MAEKSYLTLQDRTSLAFVLRSEDFGWDEREEPKKKVILTNPEALKGVKLTQLATLFMGTGHCEWEYLMGAWLLEAVGEAINTGEPCDITVVFNTDFLAAPEKNGKDYRRFTKEQVYKHLIRFFKIEEETDTVLKLSSKIIKRNKK